MSATSKFPDTWDELQRPACKLKKARASPIGFELGHGFGDNHGWLYPLLWSLAAAKWSRTARPSCWTATKPPRPWITAASSSRTRCSEDVLGWTDAEQQQGVPVGADLLHQQRRLHPVVRQERLPRHGQGYRPRAEPERPQGHASISSPPGATRSSRTPRPGAGEAFPALDDGAQAAFRLARFGRDATTRPSCNASTVTPMWDVDPRNMPYRDSLATAPPAGLARAGQPARPSQSVAKYVVVDMFAKACAGASTKDVIANRRRPAQADLRPGLIVASAHRHRPARRCSRRAQPPSRMVRARGRVLLADDPAAVAVPGGPGRLSVRYGIWLSLQARPVAQAGAFVGLGNFVTDCARPGLLAASRRTPSIYTFVATVLKTVGGLGLALVMNQAFPLKNLVRALMLLPFIVPTVLSTIAWMWILDPSFSVVNWILVNSSASPIPVRPGSAIRSGDVLADHGQHLARPAVLRHHPAGGAADDPGGTARGRHDRRRQHLGPLPLRYAAAAEAGHLHRHDVLGDLHLLPTSSWSTC